MGDPDGLQIDTHGLLPLLTTHHRMWNISCMASRGPHRVAWSISLYGSQWVAFLGGQPPWPLAGTCLDWSSTSRLHPNSRRQGGVGSNPKLEPGPPASGGVLLPWHRFFADTGIFGICLWVWRLWRLQGRVSRPSSKGRNVSCKSSIEGQHKNIILVMCFFLCMCFDVL